MHMTSGEIFPRAQEVTRPFVSGEGRGGEGRGGGGEGRGGEGREGREGRGKGQ